MSSKPIQLSTARALGQAVSGGSKDLSGRSAAPTGDAASLPPFPAGWYAVGLVGDLAPGQVVARTYFGREVVLFRSESGVPGCLDAYCPHMGAHLGHGGQVQGETIRCPFHGFRFDATGACAALDPVVYGDSKVPPRARAGSYPTVDRNGVTLVWWHPEGEAPRFEVPEVDSEEPDAAEWTTLRSTRWTVPGHPQESSENSVDTAHFSVVHGYRNVAEVREAAVDGPRLTVRYAMTRDNPFGPGEVSSEFDVTLYGLGYSRVDVVAPDKGLRARQLVLATPVDGDTVELRLTVRLAPIESRKKLHPLAVLLPSRWLQWIISRIWIRGFAADVSQDLKIWANKRYEPHPALAGGDGAIGTYRRWARQFYS